MKFVICIERFSIFGEPRPLPQPKVRVPSCRDIWRVKPTPPVRRLTTGKEHEEAANISNFQKPVRVCVCTEGITHRVVVLQICRLDPEVKRGEIEISS